MRDFSVSEGLRTFFALMVRDIALILQVAAAWFVVVAVADSVLVGITGPGPVVSVIVSLLAASLFGGALTYAAVGRYSPSFSEAIGIAQRAFRHVLAVSAIATVATMFGLMMLVIPGLVAAWLLALVVPVVLAERPGIPAAVRRSAELAIAARFPFVGYILIIALPLFFALGLISVFLISAAPGEVGAAISGGLIDAVSGVVSTYAAAAAYLVMTDRRTAEVIDAFD